MSAADEKLARANSPSALSTASSNAALLASHANAPQTTLKGHNGSNTNTASSKCQDFDDDSRAACRSNNSSMRSTASASSINAGFGTRQQRAMSAPQIAQVQQQALLFQQQRDSALAACNGNGVKTNKQLSAGKKKHAPSLQQQQCFKLDISQQREANNETASKQAGAAKLTKDEAKKLKLKLRQFEGDSRGGGKQLLCALFGRKQTGGDR